MFYSWSRSFAKENTLKSICHHGGPITRTIQTLPCVYMCPSSVWSWKTDKSVTPVHLQLTPSWILITYSFVHTTYIGVGPYCIDYWARTFWRCLQISNKYWKGHYTCLREHPKPMSKHTATCQTLEKIYFTYKLVYEQF